MARIRPNSNPNQPIPNNPFYSPETTYFEGPYYPSIINSTSGITVGLDGVITVTGGGGAVSGIFAGTGISVSGNTGNVTITNTGVTNITAGTGITVSANTGSITISASGGTGTVTTVNSGTGLTGGPITTSGTLSLTNTGVTAGSYTVADITVDAQGRITSAANGSAVTSVGTGTGLTGGPVTSTGTIALADTTVAPGAYTYGSFTVDQQGRLTAASSGAQPVTCTSFTAKGDIIVGTGANTFTALVVGTDGEVLSANSACAGGVEWVPAAGGSVTSVATTAALTGGPITTSGTLDLATTAVTAGSYTYTALTVDACGRVTAAADGCDPVCKVEYTAKGDVIAGTGAGTVTALGVGTDGQVLVADSTCTSGLKWDTPSTVGSATPTVEGILYGCTTNSDGTISLGYNAAPAATSLRGIYIGHNTGCAVTGGASSTIAIGHCSLIAATTGTDSNVVIGHGAANSATTASGNIALGSGAVPALTSGCYNIVVGNSGALNLSTGSENILLGRGVGFDTATDHNIIIGSFLCAPNGTGGELAIGCGQLGGPNSYWLTGDNTFAIKPGAGIIDCTGSCGTAGQVLASDGANAICWTSTSAPASATPTTEGTLYGCTTTTDGPVKLGYNAAPTATALYGVFIGKDAGCALTAGGGSSVVIGHCSLTTASTASNVNIVIGNCAAQAVTNGGGNIAIGEGSIPALTTGNHNTVIGRGGALNLATGNSNILIGRSVALDTTTDDNIVIGNLLCAPNGTGKELAIGYGGGGTNSYWLTGDNTLAIKPGAGIIDCAGSCGTAGQVLASDGANAVCWTSPQVVPSATPTVEGIVYGCTSPTDRSVSLGQNALGGLTDSVIIGQNAACSRTSGGGGSVIIGSEAACGATSLGRIIAIGEGALGGTETGGGNVVLGFYSLAALTGTSLTNTALGCEAGYTFTGGCHNVFLGARSGDNLTSGDLNVAIGRSVCLPSATGSCQLAIGWGDGFTNNTWLTGDSTLAIKPGAGIVDCAGSCGTAGQLLSSDGANAIEWVTVSAPTSATPTVEGLVYGCTGSSDVSLGINALLNTTSTNANIAIGAGALCDLTTGQFNTTVGYQAGQSLTAGDRNTLVGYQSGSNLVGNARNTALGWQSLFNSTGLDNVALGYFAGACLTSGCKNVVIGYEAQASSPTDSCQLAIGYSQTCNWLTGNSTRAIQPGAGIIDCAGSCGTSGQVLQSTGSNAIEWATPAAGLVTLTTTKAVTSGTTSNIFVAQASGTADWGAWVLLSVKVNADQWSTAQYQAFWSNNNQPTDGQLKVFSYNTASGGVWSSGSDGSYGAGNLAFKFTPSTTGTYTFEARYTQFFGQPLFAAP